MSGIWGQSEWQGLGREGQGIQEDPVISLRASGFHKPGSMRSELSHVIEGIGTQEQLVAS